MIRLLLFLGLFIGLSSCQAPTGKSLAYNTRMSDLILGHPAVKSKLLSTFNLKSNSSSILKVLISRRDRFVRVTIYQLVNKNELEEYPSSFFTYNSNTFICYDGSEVIEKEKVDKGLFDKLKKKLTAGNMNDSRVLQFDIDSYRSIKFNFPAVNPFDLTENTNLFPANAK
jgi:hypothetical protein